MRTPKKETRRQGSITTSHIKQRKFKLWSARLWAVDHFDARLEKTAVQPK